ncbi:MAG: hypothetical protein JWQ90_5286 [Hydrocarboniphaga sp.]|nr:hypothetical protein [Hydrocarboniphaga sp.]
MPLPSPFDLSGHVALVTGAYMTGSEIVVDGGQLCSSL